MAASTDDLGWGEGAEQGMMPRNVGRVRLGDHKTECDVYYYDDVANFVISKKGG